MAYCRVETADGYTVMSNYHLRDMRLSLKARGLLSQILSLPESWDMTISGLSKINRECSDTIASIIKELEATGYITRYRERRKNGTYGEIFYDIRMKPRHFDDPKRKKSERVKPKQMSSAQFNLYDDIRDKLIAKGVPKEEIAFIHEADSEAKKKELFSKVRQGKVRVLLGSTAKCGAGTNIQDKLIALHHLDCPWRPSDLEQREGRIIRQGNENKEVEVYRYMTETFY